MNKVKVLFVCLGNICRSPLAEGIFRQRIKERGMGDRFEVDSCGTAAYHIGKSPDERSVANAIKNGVNYEHAARQLKESDFLNFDYIIPMDSSNHSNTLRLEPKNARAKVIKMREFDDLNKGDDVPDPYYGGENGFQEVFEILDRSVDNLLSHLEKGSEPKF
ncbi:low molecular weight protein-tyrosine-phosphatase [Roseivirga misakiensis]|uniref:protein-tyrosine-phosphatase n=1 Tax=Roseivirga misakiensis TaxID=1563681 RepID=A0A1E5T218_9BACT|nr:low molecular weight protein-tyrosine-phosphatase [Roseivirga misakiensis]OEK05423.1 protein tyrosine phosphatase [Roseivirga misakiensis]